MTARSDGYLTITTIFCVKGADAFISFCKDVLGAEERMRRSGPNDSVVHADLQVGDTIFWVTDSINDPATTTSSAYFVDDCDAVYDRAIRLGAKQVFAPKTTSWGGRWARVEDPWGNYWTFSTPIPVVAATPGR